MIHIAVCDDHEYFLQQLKLHVDRWIEESGRQAEVLSFTNGDALLARCQNTHMDVIFMDILMPLLNGIETARELRVKDSAVKIIFLTSSPEFALDSYSVKANGYLLKPVSYEKIKEVLDETVNSMNVEAKSLTIRTTFGYRKLYLHQIEYVEAQNKKVCFYLRSGDQAEAVGPLHVFAESLTDENGFFQCHRSYIVYLPNVSYFNSTEIITRSGRKVPIARGFGKAFQEAYFRQMFED